VQGLVKIVGARVQVAVRPQPVDHNVTVDAMFVRMRDEFD
jgi:hypothetical protein